MSFAPAALPTAAFAARPRVSGVRRFAVGLAVAFGATAVGLFVAPAPADAWSGGEFSSSSEKQLVSLTNQSRAAAGLKALKVDSALTAIARSRSKDMIVRDYFSHTIPGGGNVFSILDRKGYCYVIAGENIGWNNYPDDAATKTVHRMFMESAGHRSNIMSKKWDVIGVGAYKSSTGKKMWTVLFADKCGKSSSGGGGGGGSAPKPPKPKATPKPTPKPTPVPTPVRTMPPEPTDPIGLAIGPGDRSNANGGGGATQAPAPRTAPIAGGGSLRVVEPSTPPGLVETIVGDVTGFFLGG